MGALTNENFKESGLDLDLLNRVDAAIWQVQKIYHEIKTNESYAYNGSDIETVGQYIKKYPEIFLTTYNDNDEITIEIIENAWEIDLRDYDDYQNFVNRDLEKIEKKVNDYLEEQKALPRVQ